MYKIISLTLLLGLLLTNCKNLGIDNKTLESEVIAIHDEVMPRSMNLFLLKQELQLKLNNGLDSTQVFELISLLDEADEGMRLWMDQYESPSEDMSHDDTKEYLLEQKELIQEVKEITDRAYEKVTSALNIK